MTLRAMRWWDVEPLVTVERDLFGPEAWSAALFWSELAQWETRHYLVDERAGELVGYAGLAVLAGEGYVQTLAVRRSDWHRGVGRGLLDALLAEADRRAAAPVHLEVRADDPRAQRLYRAAGFRPVGRRPGYYERAGVDAVVMSRHG